MGLHYEIVGFIALLSFAGGVIVGLIHAAMEERAREKDPPAPAQAIAVGSWADRVPTRAALRMNRVFNISKSGRSTESQRARIALTELGFAGELPNTTHARLIQTLLALMDIEESTKRVALASQLFGSDWKELLLLGEQNFNNPAFLKKQAD